MIMTIRHVENYSTQQIYGVHRVSHHSCGKALMRFFCFSVAKPLFLNGRRSRLPVVMMMPSISLAALMLCTVFVHVFVYAIRNTIAAAIQYKCIVLSCAHFSTCNSIYYYSSYSLSRKYLNCSHTHTLTHRMKATWKNGTTNDVIFLRLVRLPIRFCNPFGILSDLR